MYSDEVAVDKETFVTGRKLPALSMKLLNDVTFIFSYSIFSRVMLSRAQL